MNYYEYEQKMVKYQSEEWAELVKQGWITTDLDTSGMARMLIRRIARMT